MDGDGPRTRWPAGTLGYISPEQARGERVDGRSDLFSLGVVLYEMATGRRPFRGDTPEAFLRAVLEEEPVRARTVNSAVPRELEGVIRKALEKAAGARWQSAAEMAEALRRVTASKRFRITRWAVAAAAAVAGLRSPRAHGCG
jgi:serine/threonine protein kinase